MKSLMKTVLKRKQWNFQEMIVNIVHVNPKLLHGSIDVDNYFLKKHLALLKCVCVCMCYQNLQIWLDSPLEGSC